MEAMTNNDHKLTPEEKWERATLANNFIFYKVMRYHPEACKYLIEMLLGIKIQKMEMHGEETIEHDYDSHGIRLDVYVKDSEHIYDVEMQMSNTNDLPERSRYYQGLMDLDNLKSGQKYKELKTSHVIFICMEDIFKNGLPVNTFENICLEDMTTKLNDRALKHFFIAPACAKMLKDKNARDFFNFLISNKSATDYTNNLKNYVADAKHNSQWRFSYMTWERQRTYDLDTGREEGRNEKAVEDAVLLIKKYNVEPKTAAADLNAPLEKVIEALKAREISETVNL